MTICGGPIQVLTAILKLGLRPLMLIPMVRPCVPQWVIENNHRCLERTRVYVGYGGAPVGITDQGESSKGRGALLAVLCISG